MENITNLNDKTENKKSGTSHSESEQDAEHLIHGRRLKRRALRSPELINSFKLDTALSSFKHDITEHMTHLFKTFQENQDAKFSSLMSDITAIKEEVKEIRSDNAKTEKKINVLTSHFENVTDRTAKLENIVEINNGKIKQLENQIENINRQACAYKIELRNIPSRPQESSEELRQITDSLLKALKIEALPYEIRNVRRAPGKTDAPRPIVLEVATTSLKNKIIKETRCFNINNKSGKLNTSHLSIQGPPRPVYIGENLTYKAKGVFYKAREFAKQNHYAFCWSSNGQIYLRKEEGAKSIVVREEDQLQDIGQNA